MEPLYRESSRQERELLKTGGLISVALIVCDAGIENIIFLLFQYPLPAANRPYFRTHSGQS